MKHPLFKNGAFAAAFLLALFIGMKLSGCSFSPNEPVCGDGIINQDQEWCDMGVHRGELSCRDLDFVRGEIKCTPQCTTDTTACESAIPGPGVCGNAMLESGEECDVTVAPGLDCARLDLGLGEITCTLDCRLDPSQCSGVGAAAGGDTAGADTAAAPECGDSFCNGGEDCQTCPLDCGQCPPGCPDGQCMGTESCQTCPQDCGMCPPICSDGKCNGNEHCQTCPQDCGYCPPGCPNGLCGMDESCKSCPQDCGVCPSACPDNVCNGTEDCNSCPQDCGVCPPACPDNVCNGNEDCNSCPQDCGACPPACPDNVCNGNETCASCPQDCDVCPCQAANYWSPTSANEVDQTGLQWNQTINVSIDVQVRQTGKELEFRVCKLNGVFSENVAFHIYDGASNYAWAQHQQLVTANQSCSSWYGLANDLGYAEGQQFGGIWQMVSPWTSRNDWNWPASSCSIQGQPTGTCWNGVNITLTRTCKN